MILISHRGNLNGKNPESENTPEYIQAAIDSGFEVEIDLWVVDGNLFLGHDNPETPIDYQRLRARWNKLRIHCKNKEALIFLSNCVRVFRYFWHEEDFVTLTSLRDIWAYPGNQPIENSIAVMPEINNDDLSLCKGICSDFIIKYKR